jgi:hypothetical protein
MIINDKYKIEADVNNIILFEAHKITGKGKGRPTTKKAGEIYWTPTAYVQSFQEAIKCLIKLEVRETELNDLESINKRFDEIMGLVNKLQTPSELSR